MHGLSACAGQAEFMAITSEMRMAPEHDEPNELMRSGIRLPIEAACRATEISERMDT